MTVLRGLNLVEVCFYALPLTLGVFLAALGVYAVVEAQVENSEAAFFGLLGGVVAGIVLGGIVGAWITGGNLTAMFEQYLRDVMTTTPNVPVPRIFIVGKALLFLWFVMQFYVSEYGFALSLSAVAGGIALALYCMAKIEAHRIEEAKRRSARLRREQRATR
jgi:hypothetical protein